MYQRAERLPKAIEYAEMYVIFTFVIHFVALCAVLKLFIQLYRASPCTGSSRTNSGLSLTYISVRREGNVLGSKA